MKSGNKERRKIPIKPIQGESAQRLKRSEPEPTTIWVPPSFKDPRKSDHRGSGDDRGRTGAKAEPAEILPAPVAMPYSLPKTRRRRRSSAQNVQEGTSRRNYAVFAYGGLAVIFAAVFYFIGAFTYRPAATGPARAETPEVAPEQQQLLEDALKQLRLGETKPAMEKLVLLESQNPDLPSLSYLKALVALQNGDIAVASAGAEASIRKNERISDALAVNAAVEGLKTGGSDWKSMGDADARAMSYLCDAIKADAANPYPYVELAMRQRSQGHTEDARRLLESAQLRLPPIDTYVVIDTTLLLMRLQKEPDDRLPDDIDPDKNPASLMGASYVAMRHGDFARAGKLLETAKHRMPPDLYYYLIADPAFRDFSAQQEIARFFH